MLQFLKDLSIRAKIAGFVIPSTLLFGLLMTCLTIYFLNDFKDKTLEGAARTVTILQQESGQAAPGNTAAGQLEAMAKDAEKTITSITYLFVSIVVAVLVMATVGAMVISSLIGRSVQAVATRLENISSGDADLTQRLVVMADDDTGKVARYFNAFLEKLQGIVKDMQRNAIRFEEATESICGHVKIIQGKTDSAKTVAQTVFRSAGYMSRDMKEIATILEESTANIAMISAAVGELTATVGEIASTSAKANHNTEATKSRMERLEQEVNELEQASEDISNVTQTITDISGQVNLLALNATIEAARAGEAGKGFAVVANEIKELAKQTAGAAAEIKSRIDQMQHVTGSTITGIKEATTIVSQNTEVVATIASAVEEQTATVNEIAGSLSSATEKLKYSNDKVFKAAEHADNMAAMATTVTEEVDGTNKAVLHIRESAETLKDSAEDSARTARLFRT